MQADAPAPVGAPTPASPLDASLSDVLDRVLSGEDTLARLCVDGMDCGEVALALVELELLGLLHRDAAGRYLPPG